MKKKQLGALALLLALVLTVLPLPAEAEEFLEVWVSGTFGQSEARSMLESINAFRTDPDVSYEGENGEQVYPNREEPLEPFTYDYGLEAYARQRAMELALSFSHVRPNGHRAIFDIPGGYGGENIAMGYRTADDAFMGWREDGLPFAGQGHRRNMLHRGLTKIGIGHAVVNGAHYWVQSFSNTSAGSGSAAPVDGPGETIVEVDPTHIEGLTSDCPSEVTLKVGERFDQQEVYITFYVGSTGPMRSQPQGLWSVEDEQILMPKGLGFEAIKTGTTRVTFSAWEESLTFTVHVVPNPEECRHSLEKRPGKEATCTEKGLEDCYLCTRCQQLFSDSKGENPIPAQKELPRLGHDYQWIIDTKPTDTKDGLKHEQCSRCGKEGLTIILPSGNHVHKGVLQQGKQPTCTESGRREYYLCACGACFQDSGCTKPIADIESWAEIPAPGHSFGDWVTDKQATANTPGSRYRECTVCGSRETRSTAATGGQSKDWQDPEYLFSEDFKTCKAVRKNRSGQEETATARVTARETWKASCKEAGEITYTAQFAEAWAGKQTRTEKTELLPHDYQWVEDQGERYQKCTVCGHKGKTEQLPTEPTVPETTEPSPEPTEESRIPEAGQSRPHGPNLLLIGAMIGCLVLAVIAAIVLAVLLGKK